MWVAPVTAVGIVTFTTPTLDVTAEDKEAVTGALTGADIDGVAVHPSGAPVYVADWYEHRIHVVDPAAGTVTADIPVGVSPSGLATTPDGAMLLSADRDSNEISIIDTKSNARIAQVTA